MLRPYSTVTPGERAKSANDVYQQWKTEYKLIEIAEYAFDKLDLSSVTSKPLALRKVVFSDCTLNAANFANCTIDQVKFVHTGEDPTQLRGAHFDHAKLTSAVLTDCDLQSADFRGATLSNCNLSNSDLRNSIFESATITDSDFRNVLVNSATSFLKLNHIKAVKFDRYSLACLGEGRGNLTEGNLMKMDIIDDVAILRSQFGGIWMWIHLTAILVFIFPYAWFLVSQWALASFRPPTNAENSMSLGQALLGFIITGGGDWKHDWSPAVFSIIFFVVFLLYNVGRMALLWKTKKLETQQIVTRLPVEFSLQTNRWWRMVYNVTKWGFAVAIGAALFNTAYFLSMRVPLD